MPVRPFTDPEAAPTWNAVSAGTAPFGDPRYASALSDLGVPLAVASGDRASALVCTGRTGPFRRAFPAPLTPFTPVVTDSADDEASVHARSSSLEEVARLLEESFADVLLHLAPSMTDLRVLQWRGWTVQPRFTYRLDPATARDPGTWSSAPRRMYRQHVDDFDVAEDPAAADTVAALCRGSYGRHDRRAPIDRARLGELARRVVDSGLGRVFVARDRADRAKAGVVLLTGPDACYYWMAGSEPGPAMTVLLGSVMERLADERAPAFDFVGANTASIAEFKRRFGPRLVTYHAARFTASRALRVLRGFRSP